MSEEKKHLLLVDDIITNIEILDKVLKNQYRLGRALNGEDALLYAREKSPDMILLDINMPDITGIEVCKILKSDKDTKDILIIFISGLHDVQSKTRGFEAGGVDYIVKPFNVEEVRARIKTHLELQEYRNKLEEMVQTRTQQLHEANDKLILSQIQLIHRLGVAGEYKDNETGQHVNRVCLYSGIIARAMGLDSETIEFIRMCSPLHDIGKIGIPDKILLKPGPLSDEEWDIMRQHSGIGVDILMPSIDDPLPGTDSHSDKERVAKLIDIASNIAGYHHEKWDGTGYPAGLDGNDIPIEARIVSVADVFDALSNKRPYKEPFSEEKCLSILREMSGKAFDPDVIDAFFKSIELILQVKKDLKE